MEGVASFLLDICRQKEVKERRSEQEVCMHAYAYMHINACTGEHEKDELLFGRTLLIRAYIHGYFNIVEILVSNGANIQVKNNDGGSCQQLFNIGLRTWLFGYCRVYGVYRSKN